MNKVRITATAYIAGVMLLLAGAAHSQTTTNISDEEVRRAIITQSIASYPGKCACPYNATANGSRCGKRSAWSKQGGFAPLWYPEDVTDEMIVSKLAIFKTDNAQS